MKGSFKKLDYSLRPAKHAERRMICDIFRRLKPFCHVEDYIYVGFGSVWFTDFSLFHRTLGIKYMISIEEKESARERIEDNKPFRISVDYRHSKHALPDLNWTRKQFIWLDYDEPISTDIIHDMQIACRRASSGTVLAVSVQCTQAPQIAEANDDSAADAPNALERFRDTFGRSKVSPTVSEADLYGWSFATVSRSMLLQEIEATVAVRNSAHERPDILFKLICEVEYMDDAKMTTIVGVFYSPDDERLVEECNFEALDFLRGGNKPVRIKVPKLTIREFKRLESQLPLPDSSKLDLGSIPLSEARHFAELYRYLPNFAILEG